MTLASLLCVIATEGKRQALRDLAVEARLDARLALSLRRRRGPVVPVVVRMRAVRATDS